MDTNPKYISSTFTNEKQPELEGSILREAISLLSKMDPDPIVGIKINNYDFEEMKQRLTFKNPTPNTTGIPPVCNGIALYLDPDIPRGRCKPIRKSQLKEIS